MADRDLTVRPATASDVTQISRIYAHHVLTSTATLDETSPTAADWWRRLDGLQAAGLPFLVADAAGEVVGYAYCAPWRHRSAYRHTVQDSVYLAPESADRGTGQALLARLLEAAAGAGMLQVIAVIADTGDIADTASAALHRGCGFVEAGRLSRVGHKHGQWVDTVLMQRSLP